MRKWIVIIGSWMVVAAAAGFSPADKPKSSLVQDPPAIEILPELGKFGIDRRRAEPEKAGASKTADEPPKSTPVAVGTLAQPERVEIRGAAAFPIEEIRQGLFRDPEVLAAATAKSPLGAYLRALRERTVAGYKHGGFPDATATATLDQRHGQIILTIVEGRRCQAGEIRVEGTRQLSISGIVDALALPQPDTKAHRRAPDQPLTEQPWQWLDQAGKALQLQKAEWQPGKPARFDEPFADSIRSAVERACAWQGFLSPTFKVQVTPRQGDKRVADLVVHFADEGRLARIDRIEISGNCRATPEKILAATGLKPGLQWTRDERDRVERILWHSARFKKFDFELPAPADVNAPLVLRVSVVENDRGPAFGEPFTPAELAILRVRQWVLDFASRGDDLVAEDSSPGIGSGKFIVSRHGTLMRWRFGLPNLPASEYEALLRPGAVGLHCPTRGRKLDVQAPGYQVIGTLRMALLEAVDNGQRSKLEFGWGFAPTNPDCVEPPVKLCFGLAPAAFVDMVHDESAELADGLLVLKGRHLLRANAATGELLEFRIGEPAEEPDSVGITISIKPGEFDREVKQLTARADRQVNDVRPGRLLASLAHFVLDEPLVWQALGGQVPDKPALESLRHLLDRGVLNPFDELLADWGADQTAKFYAPVARDRDPKTNISSLLSYFAATWLPRIFSGDSWPYLLCRDGLVFTDKTDRLVAALERVAASDSSGPLAYLAVSRLMLHWSARYAAPWARAGLAHLTVDDFRRECDLLLNPRYVPGQCALRLADALKQLDASQLAHLRPMLKPAVGEDLAAIADRIVTQQDRPSGEALALALEDRWQTRWRAAVAAKLEQFEVEGTVDRARYFAEQGLYKRAMTDVGEALALDHRHVGALVLRGWLWTQRQEYGKAVADYREALRIDPRHDYAANAQAWLLATCSDAAIRDAARAVELARTACELTEWKQPEPMNTLAAAYAEAGDFAAAIEWQTRAAELTPPAQRAALLERLSRYEQHEPQHDEPLRR